MSCGEHVDATTDSKIVHGSGPMHRAQCIWPLLKLVQIFAVGPIVCAKHTLEAF